MKFCKKLREAMDLSNPEWAPYWTNYKLLKKLIKTLEPPHEDGWSSDEEEEHALALEITTERAQKKGSSRRGPQASGEEIPISRDCEAKSGVKRHLSMSMSEDNDEVSCPGLTPETPEASKRRRVSTYIVAPPSLRSRQRRLAPASNASSQNMMALLLVTSRSEAIFFRLLHRELDKAIHFFSRRQDEMRQREILLVVRAASLRGYYRERDNLARIEMREQKVLADGVDNWRYVSRAAIQLHRDLLLLESYAIMIYCSFSKILKKHDKVTGYNTKVAFMKKKVNTSVFMDYPEVNRMLSSCKELIDEATAAMVDDVSSERRMDMKNLSNHRQWAERLFCQGDFLRMHEYKKMTARSLFAELA